MQLPVSSMPVPGVYYPILKALAWEGINVVELVSAGTELTFFFEDKDVTRALAAIRVLTGAPVATPLELFDWVASDLETIQAWNEAVKAFLSQDQKENALSVRL